MIMVIMNIINNLKKKGYITEKQQLYLLGVPEPRPRRFYILPKIHKPPTKWKIPDVMPPGVQLSLIVVVTHIVRQTIYRVSLISPFNSTSGIH